MNRSTMKKKVRLLAAGPRRPRRPNRAIFAAILCLFVFPLVLGPSAALVGEDAGSIGILSTGLLFGLTAAAAKGSPGDIVNQLTTERTLKLVKMKEISTKVDQGEDDVKAFDALELELRGIDERIQRIQKVSKLEAAIIPRAQITPTAGDPGGSAAPITQDPNIGMSGSEIREYSICRALLAAVDRNWDHPGLVKEASDAMAEKIGREASGAESGGGFLIPNDVALARVRPQMTEGERQAALARFARGREYRDITIAGDGSNIISTQLGTMIELLRKQLVLQAAGATILPDLIGKNIAFPRQTAGAGILWVGESGNVTETALTIDQVALAAKTAGAFTDISRQLLKQSSVDVETFVRMDLMRTLALEIDFQGLHGDGTSDKPTGIALTTGINTVEMGDPDGAVPTWAKIVDLETQVAIDNAAIGGLNYVTNANVRGKLKGTEKASSTGLFIWNDMAARTPVNGYPVLVSNQIRSDLTKGTGTLLSAIFFGNFADLLIGLWGGMDVLVDPYTGGIAGTLRVIIHQDVGFAVRHPESFCLADDMVTV